MPNKIKVRFWWIIFFTLGEDEVFFYSTSGKFSHPLEFHNLK